MFVILSGLARQDVRPSLYMVRSDSSGKVWRQDGSPGEIGNLDVLFGSRGHPAGATNGVEFVFVDKRPIDGEPSFTLRTPGATLIRNDFTWRMEQAPWYAGFHYSPPDGIVATDLSLGFADGPWRVAAKYDPTSKKVTGIPITAELTAFARPKTALAVGANRFVWHPQIKVRVKIPDSVAGEAVRVRALGRNGQPLQAAGWIIPNDLNTKPTDYAFEGKVSDVGTVLIEARPYRWLQITNVHLAPNDN